MVDGPAATGDVAEILAQILADLVSADEVSLDSHFFDDLGADSLVMAHFCARVRKRADVPSVSMKDIYRHSTIRLLTEALVDQAPAPVAPAPTAVATVAAEENASPRSGSLQYLFCGALQLLIFLEYSYLVAFVTVRVYEWVSAGSGFADVYLRSALSGVALFLFVLTLPICAKWILIGRWKRQEIRIWSLAYVRFWLVKTLVQRNLLVFLLAGSPLYSFYLRALGAKVGRGVTIFSLNVPLCTDLLTIGAGTVIRKDSFINCYRAHDGMIQTGAVTLGEGAFVGEVTVIDIETSVGDGAQLGHSSALHAGQSVPENEHWHGSPAQRTDVDYRGVEPRSCGSVRRGLYVVSQLLALFLVYLPLALGGMNLLVIEVPQLEAVLNPEAVVVSSWAFYRHALEGSLLLLFVPLLTGLLLAVTVPRVLNLAIEPDKVYPLYGAHYSLHRTIARLTNLKIYTFLFGDSSYIVNYLRWIGYDLPDVRQTGSNFGQAVKHENPFLCTVGSGTMVADGLSIINADFSTTSFRVSRTSIGANSFLGNRIAYPSQGRTGDNCLLATKVMVPTEGEVRQNVGLLGAPSFDIPRTVDRDAGFDLESEGELRRLLTAKNRHNLVTIGLFLLVRWMLVFGITVVMSAAAHFYLSVGVLAIAVANVLVLLFSVVYLVLVERAVTGLAALKPLGCSIYDRDFWRHERFWKVASVAYLPAFNGTPFKNVIWRMLGVRIGRRVFDDGCVVTERRFAAIGDDCTLNAGTILQCHSQEDGAFKSDRVSVGAGCTLGVGGFVHYGVTIGDGAVLAADSFLMKGEEMPAGAHWGGNPAREMREDLAQARVVPAASTRVPALVGG